MRKFALFVITTLALGSVFFITPARAQTVEADSQDFDKIQYVLFHLETCPHCRDEIKFINKKLKPQYGQYIDFIFYEVSSADNQEVFAQYGKFYNVSVGSVPMAFIDDQIVSGYGTDKTTGAQITGIVENLLAQKGVTIQSESEQKPPAGEITVPILGTINPATYSLPLLTITLGLLDGFNPCAMWALLFLIALLLGMENRRKMWILGSLFIFASGLVYFVFMAAWLKFIMFIGLVFAIRLIIGLFAMAIGGQTIWKFWQHRQAEGVVCDVSSQKGNQKIFEKIKNIVHHRHMLWSIVGIILLGFSVNLVELACSAGFPAIFTQVLAMSDLANWQRYAYMVFYIFWYMLDDMVVFVLAMVTLKATSMGGKYAKYVNAFSGLLIFILGLLLILKPEWLMFT